MRNRNRNFRNTFGMGRRQMAAMGFMVGGVDQFGKPRMSATPDKPGSGPGGYCVCPDCGAKVAHVTGTPCNGTKCPKCGTTMTKD